MSDLSAVPDTTEQRLPVSAFAERPDGLPTPNGSRKWSNLGLLISGFAIGQGSIFVVQTWLVASSKLEVLGTFGTAFSFAMLCILVVEAGSTTILARRVAHHLSTGGGKAPVWQAYWEVTIFRLLLALALSTAGMVGGVLSADPHTKGYALAAAPALLIWSFNFVGLLDGLDRSGSSGATAAIAYVFSAVSLVLSATLPPLEGGLIQGGGLTAGYALALAIQLVILRSTGWQIRPYKPDRGGLIRAATQGGAMLGKHLPGQLLFRLQLVLCSAVLGKETTGILVYAYQIVAAAAQVVAMVRRVEFASLVRLLSSGLDPIVAVFRHQWLGTLSTLSFAVVLAAGGMAGYHVLPANMSAASLAVAWFSGSALSGGIVLALAQGSHALGNHVLPAAASALGGAIGATLSWILIAPLGLPGLAIANIGGQVVAAAILVTWLRPMRVLP